MLTQLHLLYPLPADDTTEAVETFLADLEARHEKLRHNAQQNLFVDFREVFWLRDFITHNRAILAGYAPIDPQSEAALLSFYGRCKNA